MFLFFIFEYLFFVGCRLIYPNTPTSVYFYVISVNLSNFCSVSKLYLPLIIFDYIQQFIRLVRSSPNFPEKVGVFQLAPCAWNYLSRFDYLSSRNCWAIMRYDFHFSFQIINLLGSESTETMTIADSVLLKNYLL